VTGRHRSAIVDFMHSIGGSLLRLSQPGALALGLLLRLAR
jgi:hypothetical protein